MLTNPFELAEEFHRSVLEHEGGRGFSGGGLDEVSMLGDYAYDLMSSLLSGDLTDTQVIQAMEDRTSYPIRSFLAHYDLLDESDG